MHARHIYTVLLDDVSAGMSRDDLQSRLRERGIATSVHFRALHLHPYYQERFGLKRGMFPAAEAVSDTTLSLPLSAAMPDSAVDRVIEAFMKSFADLRVLFCAPAGSLPGIRLSRAIARRSRARLVFGRSSPFAARARRVTSRSALAPRSSPRA